MGGRTYVRRDVHDVMAIKQIFLTSMGDHIFLSMVLRACVPSARYYVKHGLKQAKNVSLFAHS